MKESEFFTPRVPNLHEIKISATEAQVCSKLCLRRHANVKGFGYEKISDKKFCNGVTSPELLVKFKTGFTLAEVLLTLAVIGIVAAITLPSLLVDTTEKAFDAQKRALHARLAQAIGMMSNLSGYGTWIPDTENEDGTSNKDGKDDAAETFLYEGLSKVYKMNNICDSDNLDKCGIPSSITKMNGDTMVFPKKLTELNPMLVFDGRDYKGDEITGNRYKDSDITSTDTKAAAFETINGESVAVFYNPNCKNDSDKGTSTDGIASWFFIQNRMCVNFVYDLNGTKGPNKVGRDIGFITALYAKNSEVVAPIPLESNLEGIYTQRKAVEACANYSDDSRLPNKHEMASLFYNKDLVGNLTPAMYWTSSVISSDYAWHQTLLYGDRSIHPRAYSDHVRCVRK